MKKINIFVILGIIILFSGCVENKINKENETILNTVPTIVPTETPQISQQININDLENKISLMQQQLNNLQSRLKETGLPTPSEKNLIPHTPFKILVKGSEWGTPDEWIFKENGEVEVKYTTWTEIAAYKLYPETNTIKINSKKLQFYGLVLYDDYATAIYENGWITWANKYTIISPPYNSVTQKYELN